MIKPRFVVPVLVLSALALGARQGEAQMKAQPAAVAARASTWQIDPTHSELSFKIRHLVSRVTGTFGEWGGTITADPQNLAGGAVEVNIKTASIDTNNERRDTHLKSGDFFDAAGHPQISFKSSRVTVQGKKLRVAGNLTIRGVTKPVVLEGESLGVTKDAQGNQRIGFAAETTINRLDYGVAWNNLVEGSNMLGDEVTIEIVVAAVQK